ADGLAVHVLFQQRVVALDDLLHHQLAVVVGLGGDVGGNLAGVVGRAQGLVAVGDGLHVEQVHHAAEAVLVPDGHLNGDGGGVQAGADGAQRVGEIGPGAVHLVDKTNTRHAVLVGLPPHRLRLRFDAVHA